MDPLGLVSPVSARIHKSFGRHWPTPSTCQMQTYPKFQPQNHVLFSVHVIRREMKTESLSKWQPLKVCLGEENYLPGKHQHLPSLPTLVALLRVNDFPGVFSGHGCQAATSEVSEPVGLVVLLSEPTDVQPGHASHPVGWKGRKGRSLGSSEGWGGGNRGFGWFLLEVFLYV